MLYDSFSKNNFNSNADDEDDQRMYQDGGTGYHAGKNYNRAESFQGVVSRNQGKVP